MILLPAPAMWVQASYPLSLQKHFHHLAQLLLGLSLTSLIPKMDTSFLHTLWKCGIKFPLIVSKQVRDIPDIFHCFTISLNNILCHSRFFLDLKICFFNHILRIRPHPFLVFFGKLLNVNRLPIIQNHCSRPDLR